MMETAGIIILVASLMFLAYGLINASRKERDAQVD